MLVVASLFQLLMLLALAKAAAVNQILFQSNLYAPATVETSNFEASADVIQPDFNVSSKQLLENLTKGLNQIKQKKPSQEVIEQINNSSMGGFAEELFKTYAGVFGQMCDVALNKFTKLGDCISQTEQFRQLNSTFWYQAAKYELCGYPIQYEKKKSNLSADSVQTKQTPNGNIGIVPVIGENSTNTTDAITVTPKVVTSIMDYPPKNLEDSTAIDPALVSNYLYFISKQSNSNKNGTQINEKYISDIGKRYNLPDLDKRDLSSIIGVIGGGLGEIGKNLGGALQLPSAACFALCDTLRIGSNYVEKCWQNGGLTVAYAVCEAGCYYGLI